MFGQAPKTPKTQPDSPLMTELKDNLKLIVKQRDIVGDKRLAAAMQDVRTAIHQKQLDATAAYNKATTAPASVGDLNYNARVEAARQAYERTQAEAHGMEEALQLIQASFAETKAVLTGTPTPATTPMPTAAQAPAAS
jgi:hypothetical protein